MTLEIQKPNELINGMKDCGRIYIVSIMKVQSMHVLYVTTNSSMHLFTHLDEYSAI